MFCPTCRTRCYKHGKDRKGNQRYRCQQCKKTVQDMPYKPFGNMRIDPRTACFCLRLLAEGNSIRSTERLRLQPRRGDGRPRPGHRPAELRHLPIHRFSSAEAAGPR